MYTIIDYANYIRKHVISTIFDYANYIRKHVISIHDYVLVPIFVFVMYNRYATFIYSCM